MDSNGRVSDGRILELGSLCGGELAASQKHLPGLSWEQEIETLYGFIYCSRLYDISDMFYYSMFNTICLTQFVLVSIILSEFLFVCFLFFPQISPSIVCPC